MMTFLSDKMAKDYVNIEGKSGKVNVSIVTKTRKKRPRVSFTTQQLLELECIYSRNSYPNSEERSEIADLLKVHHESVHIWFKNRRSKNAKEKRNTLVQANLRQTERDVELDHLV